MPNASYYESCYDAASNYNPFTSEIMSPGLHPCKDETNHDYGRAARLVPDVTEDCKDIFTILSDFHPLPPEVRASFLITKRFLNGASHRTFKARPQDARPCVSKSWEGAGAMGQKSGIGSRMYCTRKNGDVELVSERNKRERMQAQTKQGNERITEKSEGIVPARKENRMGRVRQPRGDPSNTAAAHEGNSQTKRCEFRTDVHREVQGTLGPFTEFTHNIIGNARNTVRSHIRLLLFVILIIIIIYFYERPTAMKSSDWRNWNVLQDDGCLRKYRTQHAIRGPFEL